MLDTESHSCCVHQARAKGEKGEKGEGKCSASYAKDAKGEKGEGECLASSKDAKVE